MDGGERQCLKGIGRSPMPAVVDDADVALVSAIVATTEIVVAAAAAAAVRAIVVAVVDPFSHFVFFLLFFSGKGWSFVSLRLHGHSSFL